MNISKIINDFRKSIMRGIARYIRTSKAIKSISLNPNDTIEKILVCRPNHRLGNLLLTTPIVQEVANAYPDSKIDLFVKGTVAPKIFQNYSNINCFIQLPKKPGKALWEYFRGWLLLTRNSYDLVVDVDGNSASGILATQFANGRYKIFGDNLDGNVGNETCRHLAKYPVCHFRSFFPHVVNIAIDNPIPQMNLKLTNDEMYSGLEKLNKFVIPNRQTICLFTHATGKKCYSKSWWQGFYDRLKTEFPEFNIIEILPIENISRLSFKAPVFYSKDIREIGSLIANTHAFVGADSGMMHLANSVQTPTIGLFSVTDEKRYGPYGNRSLGFNTCYNTIEDCIKILRDILSSELVNKA